MNRYVLLENIANGIHAANKIRNLQAPGTRSSGSSMKLDQVALISEIIQSIAQYSPEKSRERLSNAGTICREYCNTYKNLKYHMKSGSRSPQNSKEQFVGSLRILEPVLDNRKKTAIQKIMKIYELFS